MAVKDFDFYAICLHKLSVNFLDLTVFVDLFIVVSLSLVNLRSDGISIEAQKNLLNVCL